MVEKNSMDLVNQIANVNLDVRVENMEYVNTDDVGVILHQVQSEYFDAIIV
jgi:hypothetical protein